MSAHVTCEDKTKTEFELTVLKMTWFSKYSKKAAAIAQSAARLMLVLVVLLATRVGALAAEPVQVSTARVHFPVNATSINPGYLENSQALAAIKEAAFRCAIDNESKIEIVSYSSPEGNIAYNQYLSEKRSAALRNYILSKYPTLRGRISVNPNAESWNDLRESVVSDDRLDDESRARMLELIDADMDVDVKEAELRKLPTFKHLYSTFFKHFRYAEITFTAKPAEKFSGLVVLFPLNSTEFDLNHADNASVLKALDSMLKGRTPADFKEIKIVSGCSPDGPVAANEVMSERRGASVKEFIEANYPEFSKLINLESQGEAWARLREVVVNDKTLTSAQKYEILKVVDNPALSAQAKEAALRENATWSHLLSDVLPLVRYAAIIPVYPGDDSAAIAQPALADTVAVAPADTVTAAPADTAKVAPLDTIVAPADTLVNAPADTVNIAVAQPDTLVQPVDTLAHGKSAAAGSLAIAKRQVPIAAVTTNLLYESATVLTGFHSVPLTIGLEFPLGEHWSTYANYMATAPWRAWNSNANCAELLHADLGVKWYPGGSFRNPFTPKAGRELLEGWYAYAGVGAGYYDFERNGKGYQGEELLGTLGLGYGLSLGHHWSLDFALGGGPIVTRYRYYEGRSNNEHLMYQYSGKLTYFGVTDAKVTLRYLFHYNKNVKSQETR